MDAFDIDRARTLGAAAEQHGIVAGAEVGHGGGDTDIDAVVEGHAFGFHLLDAEVDVFLLHLEVGDAVAQEATGAGLALVDMDIMAGAGELLGGGKAGRAGADDGDLLAGLVRRDLRLDPAIANGAVGDGLFHRLDGDGGVLEVQGAGFLAGRGADAAVNSGKLLVEWRLRAASSQSPL